MMVFVGCREDEEREGNKRNEDRNNDEWKRKIKHGNEKECLGEGKELSLYLQGQWS